MGWCEEKVLVFEGVLVAGLPVFVVVYDISFLFLFHLYLAGSGGGSFIRSSVFIPTK